MEGRHFYCSTSCFASSWKRHRKLHVRVKRTLAVTMNDSHADPGVMSDFGYMTDDEWDAFQLSSAFTVAMEQKQKALLPLELRRAGTSPFADDAEKATRDMYRKAIGDGLHANLDVVCSTKPVTRKNIEAALCGVGMAARLLMTPFDGDPKHRFFGGWQGKGQYRPTPNTMFEILRRNYIYHISLLAFEPGDRNRIRILAPPGSPNYEEDFRCFGQTIGLLRSEPMQTFVACFPDDIAKDSWAKLNTPEEAQIVKEKMLKRLEESYELVCPMYVCAFVATLLLQMWNARLIAVKGGCGEDSCRASSSSGSSLQPSTANSAASATSATIVQQTVTAQERAKLSSGLLKILGRGLPSFLNARDRPRGPLSFRDFLKGANGQGAREAKKLRRLENACRHGYPKPTEKMGGGGATMPSLSSN